MIIKTFNDVLALRFYQRIANNVEIRPLMLNSSERNIMYKYCKSCGYRLEFKRVEQNGNTAPYITFPKTKKSVWIQKNNNTFIAVNEHGSMALGISSPTFRKTIKEYKKDGFSWMTIEGLFGIKLLQNENIIFNRY